MAADVGTALQGILDCLETNLADADRGVCRTGLTVGAPVLGPTACCSNCQDGPGGQLSGTLQRIYPVNPNTFGQQVRIEDCNPGAVAADFAFTLARCYPMIDAKGTPPKLDALQSFAEGAVTDSQVMWQAFQCGCIDRMKVVIRDIGINSDPLGGCSAVGVTVTVLVTPAVPS